ncbi:MAG: M12 family metallo-peptidase, partial [Candidatus Poribacteria bacterium]|nr:M12 family metallo-peptidase [Candidatus Poribacteria bacterium]
MKTQFTNHKFFVFTSLIILIVLGIHGISYGQNLNVGEPRTVRMIYFLPDDLPFRADVVQKMKDVIHTVQNFYAEQMQAHGYGNKTFQFETEDQGEPKVHRVNGKHPFSYYDNTLGNAVIAELEQTFDLDANIYFIVLGADALRQGNGLPAGGVGSNRGKNGGHLVVPNGFGWLTLAHELGHTFGLLHDFRDNSYIMSYGSRQNPSLSACAAEFLSLHSYFNPHIPTAEAPPPTVELISSSTYPVGSKSITVRLKVKDADGIHQVQLHAWGGLQECRGLAGEKEAIVKFEYGGRISSLDFTTLSDAAVHNIFIIAVNTDGNIGTALFKLAEMSPYNITTLEKHTESVRSLAFSPNGQILASGSFDNTVKLWNVTTKENVDTFRHTRRVKSVAFSPDGTILASGGNDGINLWDMTTREKITTLRHGDFVNSMSFSRDGTTLASGGDDHTVKLWNVATRKNIATLRHGYYVKSVSFSRDGTILVSCAWDGTIKLWDVQAETEIVTLENLGGINAVLFSPNGTTFVSASTHGTIKIWDAQDVQAETEIATLEHPGSFPSIAFSHDGATLASGTLNGSIKLWDIEKETEIATFGYPSGITSLAFSHDGTTLATGTEFGKVELWDVTLPDRDVVISIPDPNLASEIRKNLGVPSGVAITRLDMLKLKVAHFT